MKGYTNNGPNCKSLKGNIPKPSHESSPVILEGIFTLEDDKIDEEACEFGEFFGDPMSDLSGVFRQRPYICDRTEDEVYYKVDKQIKEIPNFVNLKEKNERTLLADVRHLGIGIGNISLPRAQPLKDKWGQSIEKCI